MKALILAAGTGSRLKPLTDTTPKALLKAGRYTLLQFAILKLRQFGYTDIMVNVHHLGQQIIDYIADNKGFGCQVTISDERDQLLDTGGAIKKAAWFFDDGQPFVVYNADVVCDLDLSLLRQHHIESRNLATLVVRNRPSGRLLLFDEFMQLKEWRNAVTGERKVAALSNTGLQAFAFSGIHIINPELTSMMEQTSRFSIIDTYLRLAATHPIGALVDHSTLWADAGKPESLNEAGRMAELIHLT